MVPRQLLLREDVMAPLTLVQLCTELIICKLASCDQYIYIQIGTDTIITVCGSRQYVGTVPKTSEKRTRTGSAYGPEVL